MSFSQGAVCLSCQGAFELGVFLPHLAGVVIEGVVAAAGLLLVSARAKAGEAACPGCGTVSGRVHSRYARRLADAAVGGRRVVIRLTVRRFFCACAACESRTFAEQVPGLTARYARKTPLLAGVLRDVAAALAGRAGSRLAGRLGAGASRQVLLRLVMTTPDPPAPAPRVLGVDDFAFRRGRDYGTILVNAETGQPVDLLPDREAATLARWLEAHPGTGVICRDRAGAYADGARQGAPDAVQVADRWHVWHNLCGHVAKAAARHRGCLAEDPPEPGPASAGAGGEESGRQDGAGRRPPPGTVLAARTRERHALVQALRAQEKGIKAITRETGLARETVRRFYHAASADDLAPPARPSLLDEHKPYLRRRLDEGAGSARRLCAELRERGYQGSLSAVEYYLRQLRPPRAARPAAPAPPRARDIARWILADPAGLDDDEKEELASARRRCPHLDALAAHVTAFAKILAGRHGSRLDDWLAAAEADDQPELHSFAHGIRLDYDAVRNGLTMPWNSGVVEGNVNRLKMIKRQTYGRAAFSLLRKRVLLA